MTDSKFTQYEMEVARELGALTKTIMNMDDKITRLMDDKVREHTVIWKKIDDHGNALTDHHGRIKWIMGIGALLQAIWATVLGLFHR